MPGPASSRRSIASSALAVLVAVAAPPGTVQAALVARSGGMVYDTTLDITWLADWNYARTSGYDADGLMNWGEAMAWADTLVFGGKDDGRLPAIGQPDRSCSFNDTVGGVTACVGYGLGSVGQTHPMRQADEPKHGRPAQPTVPAPDPLT